MHLKAGGTQFLLQKFEDLGGNKARSGAGVANHGEHEFFGAVGL